jgi:hypothetical protein
VLVWSKEHAGSMKCWPEFQNSLKALPGIPVPNSKLSKVQHRVRHCSKLVESLNATVQAEGEKQDRAARITSQPGT